MFGFFDNKTIFYQYFNFMFDKLVLLGILYNSDNNCMRFNVPDSKQMTAVCNHTRRTDRGALGATREGDCLAIVFYTVAVKHELFDMCKLNLSPQSVILV